MSQKSKVKHILVVCALPEELDCINIDRFKNSLESKTDHSFDIDVLICGVGKISSAVSLAYTIMSARQNDKINYDLIINLGTSGGVYNCNIFDVVYCIDICSVDVDYCGGAYSYGYDKIFGFDDKFKPAVVFSNDKFMNPSYYENENVVREISSCINRTVVYDMESFALTAVSQRFAKRFLAVKVVTDKPLVQNNYSVFEENIKPGMKLIDDIINTDMFVGGLNEILACR